MLWSLFLPLFGTHSTNLSIEWSALSRMVLPNSSLPSFRSLSIFTNHWGVFLKITGALDRQLWGYECSKIPLAISLFASINFWITALFASPSFPFLLNICKPLKNGTAVEKLLSSSTLFVIRDSHPRLRKTSKSSAPWLGAICTKPVPASSVTWSASTKGTA